MNPNEPSHNLSGSDEKIAELNVQRLLTDAYRPEMPDPAFVEKAGAAMLAAAKQRAAAPAAGRTSTTAGGLLGWAVAAALLIGVGLLLGSLLRDNTPGRSARETAESPSLPASAPRPAISVRVPTIVPASPGGPVGSTGLVARPKPPAPAPVVLALGESTETAAAERRRLALPDGSVLYLNTDTAVTLDRPRHVTLHRGEVFVEVSPWAEDATEDAADTGAKFVVATPDRQITALGTKFNVRVGGDGTRVVVTQGKVQVSGMELPLRAGQQLNPRPGDDPPISAARRASHLLDWTRELMASVESPLIPKSKHAGGSLIIKDPNGQEANLSLRKYHVDVHIEDGFARTTIDQTYFNHLTSRLEGTFYFPLPPDASLSRLAMYVEGKLMEGGMAERTHARQVFEEIVRKQKDPALLEWIDGSTFKMRVFPLEGRQEKRIVMSYTQRLPSDYDKTEYRFPGGHNMQQVGRWSAKLRVIGGAKRAYETGAIDFEKSTPGGDLILQTQAKNIKPDRDIALTLFEGKGRKRGLSPSAQTSAEETPSPSGKRLAADSGSKGTVPFSGAEGKSRKRGLSPSAQTSAEETPSPSKKRLAADSAPKGTVPFSGPEGKSRKRGLSPSAQTSAEETPSPSGKRLAADSALKGTIPFSGPVPFSGPPAGKAEFATTTHENSQYLMLRWRPELPRKEQLQRRDWIFLFEASADRDPLVARAQVEVIRGLLDNAEHDDTFSILTAGTRIHQFAAKPKPATPKNIKKAMQFLDRTHLVGALDLSGAFAAAGPLLEEADNPVLVHVGSGVPVLGQKDVADLVRLVPERAQYVGVGVGKRWSRTLMKTAASRTGGHYTQINPDEQVAWRAFDLLAVLNSPRLTDIKVTDKAGPLEFLCYEDSMADGRTLCAIARIDEGAKLPKALKVTARLRDDARTMSPFAPRKNVLSRSERRLSPEVISEPPPSGKPREWTIRVADVAGKTDYLPRTWAKLEIDRLIALGAAEHRERIIELSKAMYVISPFTSLLVLENDAMYTQYNVDRGRKDHWALYPCPAKIEVVHEPLPTPQQQAKTAPEQPEKPKGPTAADVLQTVMVRVPAPMLYRSDRPARSGTMAMPVSWLYGMGGYPYNTNVAGALNWLATHELPDGGWQFNRITGPGQIPGFNNGVMIASISTEDATFTTPGRIVLLTDGSGSMTAGVTNYKGALGSNWSGQFPTFSFVPVTTTVSVPDGGTVLIGGIKRGMGWGPQLLITETMAFHDRRTEDYDAVDFQNMGLGALDRPYSVNEERIRKRLTELKQLADNLGATDMETASLKTQLVMQEFADARRDLQRLQFAARQAVGQMQARQSLLEAVDNMEISDGEVKQYLRNDPAYKELFREQSWRLMDLAYLRNALGDEANAPHVDQFLRNYQAVQAQVDGLSGKVREEIRAMNRAEFMRELQKLEAQSGFLAEQESELKKEVEQKRLEAQRIGEFSVDLEMMRAEIDDLKAAQAGIAEERERLRVQRQKAVVDTLFQVEKAFIPTPDEPPIVYPSAEMWQELTAWRGGKYRSIDLGARKPGIAFAHLPNPQPSLYSNVVPRVEGRVLAVQPDGLVEISAGTEDGLEEGHKLYVIRESGKKVFYVGRIEVVEPGRNRSTARIDQASTQVLEGDLAATRLLDRKAYSQRDSSALNERIATALARLSVRGLAARLRTQSGQPQLTYRRPVFHNDWSIYSDLLRYAPGMNTSRADVAAVLEAELRRETDATTTGKFDVNARRLIENARGAGWQTATIRGEKDPDGKRPVLLSIDFDGTGRYRYTSTTGSGLREEVLSNGNFLWHVYPELGLGARRDMSRFHRSHLSRLIPWTLPPIADLLRHADLRAVDERTVAVVPHGFEDLEDKDGKPVPYVRVHLIFASDGRLAERRLIERPKGKTLLRETYAADGTVRWFGTDGKELAQRKIDLGPCGAPNLTPDQQQLVILPLPLRSPTHLGQTDPNQKYTAMSEDDALARVAADLAGGGDVALSILADRFFDRGDRRLGLCTLLLATGKVTEAQTALKRAEIRDVGGRTHDLLDPPADHPQRPLAEYIARYFQVRSQQQKQFGRVAAKRAAGLAPAPTDGLLAQLAEFHDLRTAMEGNEVKQAGKATLEEYHDRTQLFVHRCKSPGLNWALLSAAMEHNPSSEFYRKIGKGLQNLRSTPGLSYVARYEYARAMLRCGDAALARKSFTELHADALKAGMLPPIDADFRKAFEPDGRQEDWRKLMRGAVKQMIDKGARPAAVCLAWQARQVGDSQLADELFRMAMAGCGRREQLPTTLAAVEYLWHTGQHDTAAAVLQPLLENEKHARWPALWRLAAMVAQKREMSAQSLRYIERAMELEYEKLPESVDVRRVRLQYADLLGRYEKLAKTIASLHDEPPREFLAGAIRAADRWRALDTDPTAACRAAARVFADLGAADLAWDYLTTPLAAKPNEAAPWTDLAETLRQQAHFDLADRAYASAFEAEPGNPQILWDRAQVFLETGRHEPANELMRQLADGDWRPEFNELKSRAVQQVGGK